MSPRDAYFGRVEHERMGQTAGRIAAEMVSPYPPGVPVLVPGELIDDSTLEYLTSGVRAGMLIPDAADPAMKSVRVVARRAGTSTLGSDGRYPSAGAGDPAS